MKLHTLIAKVHEEQPYIIIDLDEGNSTRYSPAKYYDYNVECIKANKKLLTIYVRKDTE